MVSANCIWVAKKRKRKGKKRKPSFLHFLSSLQLPCDDTEIGRFANFRTPSTRKKEESCERGKSKKAALMAATMRTPSSEMTPRFRSTAFNAADQQTSSDLEQLKACLRIFSPKVALFSRKLCPRWTHTAIRQFELTDWVCYASLMCRPISGYTHVVWKGKGTLF